MLPSDVTGGYTVHLAGQTRPHEEYWKSCRRRYVAVECAISFQSGTSGKIAVLFVRFNSLGCVGASLAARP